MPDPQSSEHARSTSSLEFWTKGEPPGEFVAFLMLVAGAVVLIIAIGGTIEGNQTLSILREGSNGRLLAGCGSVALVGGVAIFKFGKYLVRWEIIRLNSDTLVHCTHTGVHQPTSIEEHGSESHPIPSDGSELVVTLSLSTSTEEGEQRIVIEFQSLNISIEGETRHLIGGGNAHFTPAGSEEEEYVLETVYPSVAPEAEYTLQSWLARLDDVFRPVWPHNFVLSVIPKFAHAADLSIGLAAVIADAVSMHSENKSAIRDFEAVRRQRPNGIESAVASHNRSLTESTPTHSGWVLHWRDFDRV